jgi:outer membrane protein
MRKLIIAGLCTISTLSAMAQSAQPKQWSLQECITYALENNISIKRQKLNAEYQSNQVKTSKLDLIPSVNAQGSSNASFGRALNTATYKYENNNIYNLNGGLNADVTLFQGFVKQNTIKQSESSFKAATESVKEVQNNIALTLTGYYLNVLFDKELLAIAKNQCDLTRQQLDKIQKLVDAGKAPMGNLLEIKSQLAKEQVNITTQENNLSLALLDLAQLLDLEEVTSFDIITPQIPEVGAYSIGLTEEIFGAAVQTMPEIKGAEFNLQAADYQYKKAKGYLYPTLSLGAGWNTYASKVKGIDNFSWQEDFKNNANSSIRLTLSIPIFNGLQSRYGIKNAKINQMDYQYALDAKKLTLRKQVQQAYADATAAFKKYQSSQEAVTSYTESFGYTEKKFNVGMLTSIDYNTAKNELTKSQSELLQAKYEYLLRCKILDFYKGVPITL